MRRVSDAGGSRSVRQGVWVRPGWRVIPCVRGRFGRGVDDRFRAGWGV